MTHQFNTTFIGWRFYLILFIILIAVSGLVLRVFDLSILDQKFLQEQGNERMLRLVNTPAFRGMIVDRNGYPLAVSTRVYSVWMNPKEFNATQKNLSKLAALIQVQPEEILAIYQKNKLKKREFAYLKRSLAPAYHEKIKSLAIHGIYTQEEYRRFYPEAEMMAQLIGFTNVDDKGQEGLELSFNEWLQGEPGKKWVIKDRLGRMIANVLTKSEQRPGRNLMLSIDRGIQYFAYRELLAGVKEHQAASGSVIVLDAKNGEILAMANFPSFNPNKRTEKDLGAMRNRAVTDILEPGSTAKPFSIAAALINKRIKANSIIDTSPGWIRIGTNQVSDIRNYGKLSITEILEVSSNVGVSKIISSVPPNLLWELYHQLGFGEETNINFPGEQNGSLIKYQPFGGFRLATWAFGYGFSVTELQLAQAYLTLANFGNKIPLSLVKVDKLPLGERVLDAKVAAEITAMMESVVTSKEGSGKYARVNGYRVAGKTGTSRLLGEHGYEKQHHTSLFVGFAPISNPRFVVAVVIHDPKGKKYHGGDVAGPIFSRIMENALRYYDVRPDAV